MHLFGYCVVFALGFLCGALVFRNNKVKASAILDKAEDVVKSKMK